MFDTQEMRAPALPNEPTTAVPLPPMGAGQPTHILDHLTAIFKHRRVAGTAFGLVVTVMMLQSYSTIPQYQTSARLEINDPRSIAVQTLGSDDPRYWEGPDVYNATQIQVLQSRDLARRVVERLDLKNHPYFNGHQPQPRDPVTLVRQARASASAWVRSLVARPTPAVATQQPPVEVGADSALINAFLAGLFVNKDRDAQIFNVRY